MAGGGQDLRALQTGIKNLRAACRVMRRDKLPPWLELDQAIAWVAEFAKIVGKAVHSLKRANFDKARGKRPSGRRLNNRLTGGMIVGVDCEGMNVGGDFILVYARGSGTKVRKSLTP